MGKRIVLIDERRRSGKSTGAVLRMIGGAMRNPGVESHIHVSETPNSNSQAIHLMSMAKEIISELRLTELTLVAHLGRVSCTSHRKGCYLEEGGERVFKEIS